MSKDIKSIPPDMNAKDALKMLIETNMSGLPVIDKDGRLIGVFTEREILKAILPVYVQQVGTFIYGEDSKSELKKISQLEKFLVNDLMRKDVPVIDEEASLTEASKMMLVKSERRIIVMRNNRPVGVVTRCDVVRALAKEAGVAL
jgi:CBS domain-containing protein